VKRLDGKSVPQMTHDVLSWTLTLVCYTVFIIDCYWGRSLDCRSSGYPLSSW